MRATKEEIQNRLKEWIPEATIIDNSNVLGISYSQAKDLARQYNLKFADYYSFYPRPVKPKAKRLIKEEPKEICPMVACFLAIMKVLKGRRKTIHEYHRGFKRLQWLIT